MEYRILNVNVMRLVQTVFLLCCLASCQGRQADSSQKSTKQDSVPQSKYRVLEFMADDKPAIALIDTTYKGFNRKAGFPLSLFITITTEDKNAKGHPTVKESVVFNSIEDEILSNMAPIASCYVGKTTMNGYRDLIFYIAEKDQKQVSQKLAEIQNKFPRVKSYVFEKDPAWDAVSEFYLALDKTK